MTHIRLWITWRLASHTNIHEIFASTKREAREERKRQREKQREKESDIDHSYQSEAVCSAPVLGTPLTYGRTTRARDWCINCNSLGDSRTRQSHAGSHHCAIISRNSSDAPTGILSAHVVRMYCCAARLIREKKVVKWWNGLHNWKYCRLVYYIISAFDWLVNN